MSNQKIVTEPALSAFASDVKGELINKIGYDELPTIIDNEPYNFRTSGGSLDIGDRETDKLIGGSVAWNQVVNKDKFISKTTSDYTITPNGDGSLSVVIINTLASATTVYLTANIGASYFKVPVTHKYAVIDNNALPSGVSYRNGVDGTSIGVNTVKTQNRTDGNILLGLSLPSGLTAQTFKISPMIIDLTQMFDATIADYIYTLEQGTTGAGVAWFRSLFPKPYYAYNAGELMSVKTSAHVMTGFNQWDEEWEVGTFDNSTGEKKSALNYWRSKNRIKVLPNTLYYAFTSGDNVYLFYYDASGNYIGTESGVINSIFTTPNNAYYLNIVDVTRNAYDKSSKPVCINLSWDGERDGEYEPYELNSYPLDSDLELRGIPKLDANNNLYYDGDEYTSDGNVNRRYGIVDFGSLTWTKSSGFFYANLSHKKASSASAVINAICSKYPIVSQSTWASNDKSVWDYTTSNDALICVVDSAYNDLTADQFKTALSGVYLVYELATPTAETADAYQNPQICDGYGTEEYVDNRAVAIPVGHETEYVKNMDRLLLPATPTADGTYTLKCTVSGGTPTLSWVADT